MGDRYYLRLNCAYCNHLNTEIYYAPTCNFYDFKCKYCGKVNFISDNFLSKKTEDVTLKEIENGFFITTNVNWNKKQIKLIKKDCKDYYKQIKKTNKNNG